MKHLFTFFLFSIFSFQLLAQGTIVGFSVNPPNPTVADEVEVYVDVSFPSGGCELDDQNFGLNGTSITASAHHCVGLLTVICNTTDTFAIGQLPAGNYTFDLTLTSGSGGPGCTPGIVPDDNDQFQFTVSPSVGIDEVEELHGFIYPNPFKDEIQLKRPLQSEAVITDLNGRTVRTIQPGIQTIDVTSLPPAVYIFRYRNTASRLLKKPL